MRRRTLPTLAALAAGALLSGCDDGPPGTGPDPDPAPGYDLVTLPVVVHVVHRGEPVGEGANLSAERIEAQIRILTEDFRREPGTPGFNTHPDGADARVRFALARFDPTGAPTSGIVRVDATEYPVPDPSESLFEQYARYGYWHPERYVNIWTMPLGESTRDVFLGMATGPETDLPGAEFLLRGEPAQPEGVLINAHHFGPTELSTKHGLGRTLTHEMGHYLGLLHLWGDRSCETNDFCADTPPVTRAVDNCSAPGTACGGAPVMIQNYMTYASDACMNLFTNDQVARMRHVLEHSPRRRELADSPALERPRSVRPAGAP